MKNMCITLVILSGLLLNAGCWNAEKAAEDSPVFDVMTCINAYYQQNGCLPADDSELSSFAAADSLTLDLTKFRVLKYAMTTDSTYTIDFETASKTHSKGGFTFNLPKKAE